jgi:hypothetical protein
MWILLSLCALLVALTLSGALAVLKTLHGLPRSNDDWIFY